MRLPLLLEIKFYSLLSLPQGEEIGGEEDDSQQSKHQFVSHEDASR